jgi:hypothetical protein
MMTITETTQSAALNIRPMGFLPKFMFCIIFYQ